MATDNRSDLDGVRDAKANMDTAIHSGNAQEAMDGIAGFAAAFGKLLAEADAKKRDRQRIRRNERARARYAYQKRTGTLPKDRKAKAAKEAELDRLDALADAAENGHRCGCQDPNASPPCWHCETCEECWEEDDD